jgi:hypothetical protein
MFPGLFGARVFGQPIWEVVPPSSTSANIPGWCGAGVFGQPIWIYAGFTPEPMCQVAGVDGFAWILQTNDLPHRNVMNFNGSAAIQR